MLKRTSTQTVSLMVPGKNDYLKLCFETDHTCMIFKPLCNLSFQNHGKGRQDQLDGQEKSSEGCQRLL